MRRMKDDAMNSEILEKLTKAYCDASVFTFAKMIMVPIVAQSPDDAADESFDISGIIGFSGDIVGNCALQLTFAGAQDAIGKLTGESVDSPAEIADGVGELVNMIAGNAKAALEEYQIALSFPEVIRGKGHEISFKHDSSMFNQRFTSEIGPINIIVAYTILHDKK